MFPIIKKYLVGIWLLTLLNAAAGCRSKTADIAAVYGPYTFDNRVMLQLPKYDSLANAIIQNFTPIIQSINPKDGYQAFRYMPSSTEGTVFRKLPPTLGENVERCYQQIGPDFIFGFDVFKDSTIKIYIRNNWQVESYIDVEENLSFYPDGKKMRQRQFPLKDTIINEHWQYWTRFSKRGLF